MTEPIHVVWELLRAVSDRCEALAWSSETEHGLRQPADWNSRHACLEYRIFGIFLLSHAMTHFKHDEPARDKAVYFCIDALAEEFKDIEVEGHDFEELVASRFKQYGDPENLEREIESWGSRLLYYLAANTKESVQLEPPIIIGDFLYQMQLELHLISCINKLYIPALYVHMVKICEGHSNIFAMTMSELETCLQSDRPGAGCQDSSPRKERLLRRIFSRKDS